MAKISALPVMTVSDGTETVPVVKAGRAAKVAFSALARLMVPFLANWYKGDRGDPGGDAGQVAPFTLAKTMSYKAGINRMRTTGRLVDGDGGGAMYDRWAGGALPSAGRDVWWFTATGDNSAWVLSPDQLFFASQFGATGGDAIDAGPILNAALNAPMVQTLNLGALTHFFSGQIIKPSGKALIGVSRSASWLKAIPAFVARQCVYTIDDVNGRFADFSLDVQRSGLGGTNAQRSSGVTIRAQNADGFGTIVDRVDVYNATGYAHYDSADYGGSLATPRKLRGIVRRQCRAFNSQVGFESTGDTSIKTIDCDVEASTVTWDGGTLVPTEAMYHEYGPIAHVHRIRCRGYGQAGAGALPAVVDPFSLRRVTYDECDIEVTSGVPALVVNGQVINGVEYRVQNLQIINCRFVSANGGGTSLNGTTATIRGGTFIGGASASNGQGNGAGIDTSTNSIVDIYAAEVVGNADPAGGGAAYGVNAQGNAVVRLHGGRVTATGPANLAITLGGTITVVSPAVLTPTPSGSSATPVEKADYATSYVPARKNSEPTVERYVPLTEIATRDANNRFILGLSIASGIPFATPLCPVNVLGSGRSFLVANSNGNNYLEMGGQGSGTAYFRAYEGNMQVGNAFAGSLHLCTGAINRWTVQSAGHLAAAADNVYSIGTAALRASVVYAGTSLINTSDEREKTWRGAMTDIERHAAKAIVAELGFYQWNDAIADKGEDDARYHFGARAQRVWTIMADHGLVDPLGSDGLPARTPYAFLCFDQWDDVFEDVMTERFGPPRHGEGMDYVKTGERLIMPAGNRFGLREGQMTLFLLGALLG